jgi:hypothetical protein
MPTAVCSAVRCQHLVLQFDGRRMSKRSSTECAPSPMVVYRGMLLVRTSLVELLLLPDDSRSEARC